jgi:hypothetical protein
MLLGWQRIGEQAFNPRTAKLTGWHADAVNHDQVHLYACRTRIAIRRHDVIRAA